MSRKCFGFTCPRPKGTAAFNRSGAFFWILRETIELILRGLVAAKRRFPSRQPFRPVPAHSASATPSLKRRGTWTSADRLLPASFATAPFERQFGDAGLVQFTKAELYHLRILLERGLRQRQVESLFPREAQGNSGIFRGVRRGEETGMFPVLHILAVGLQHARR